MRFVFLAAMAAMSGLAPGAELVGLPSVGLAASSAVVHWVTDVPCGTRVRVEPSDALVTVTEGKTPGTNHAVVIARLHPGERYTVVLGTAKVWLATNQFTTTGPLRPERRMQEPPVALRGSRVEETPPPARETWGNYGTLPDHFARHGADFHAKDQEEYARLAWEFLRRARAEGLPAKLDEEHVLRVYDPATGAFAAYNPNGTTKTFFKPRNREYFERQPGQPINLKTWNSK